MTDTDDREWARASVICKQFDVTQEWLLCMAESRRIASVKLGDHKQSSRR